MGGFYGFDFQKIFDVALTVPISRLVARRFYFAERAVPCGVL